MLDWLAQAEVAVTMGAEGAAAAAAAGPGKEMPAWFRGAGVHGLKGCCLAGKCRCAGRRQWQGCRAHCCWRCRCWGPALWMRVHSVQSSASSLTYMCMPHRQCLPQPAKAQ